MATFDPNRTAVFKGDEDPASPTTIIFKNMQAQGIPLNAGNIKSFMERIRSSPDLASGQFDMGTGASAKGPAASLRVQRDDAPSVRQAIVGKGDGNLPEPPIPPNQDSGAGGKPASQPTQQQDNPPPIPDAGSPNTSAQPSPSVSLQPPQAAQLQPPGDYPALEGPSVAELIAAGAPAIALGGGIPRPQLGGGAPPLQLPGSGEPPLSLPGRTAIAGDSVIPMGDQSVSPMESAMQKAIAPAGQPRLALPAPGEGVPIRLPDATSGPPIELGPPRGLNLTGITGGGQGAPAGPLTPARINEGQIAEGLKPPPNIDFPSRAARIARAAAPLLRKAAPLIRR